MQKVQFVLLQNSQEPNFQKLSHQIFVRFQVHQSAINSMSKRQKNQQKSRTSSSQQNPKHESQANFSSTIKEQQSILTPNLDLKDFLEINQSGYFVNENKLLGAGRYGQVYDGYSRKDQISMAVKKIPQTTQSGSNIASQTRRQIDILREICSDQTYHKNVLKYYHYQDYEGYFYVFTQNCEKGSLKQYIKSKGNQISQKEYFRIFKSIVEGMIFINKKFIIHRDLKPANILVNAKDQVKIGDFGISRQIPFRDESLTKNMCTPHYGAPQILREEEFYTQNVDVWSCGVMMYELIQNKSVYQKHRPRTKNELIKALKTFQESDDFVQFYNPNISQKFHKILKRMLTIDNTKRPAFEQIQKYIEYEQLLRFYQLQDSPGIQQQLTLGNNNTESVLIGYNQQQKQKYLKILKKYIKYKREKITILSTLQKKFMNKPYQVLWNVQKFILKYLTVNMYIIKAQQFSNWLHVSLNDNIINLQSELKIKISQFRYNYRMIAQILRDEKKKIDNDIRKYHKSLLTQAQKIEFEYLDRQKQSQRVRSYMDVNLLQDLFSHTRKNSFTQFQNYHQIYKSLMELKQYYLTYEHVQALPTFQDKQIYFLMLLIYHYDKFFNQQRYIKELLMEEEIASTERQKPIKSKRYAKEDGNNLNTNPKSFQTSITGSMAESVSDFKQRMQDEKQIMKWIFRHNLSRKQVFGNNKTILQINERSNISTERKVASTSSKQIKVKKKDQNKSNSDKSSKPNKAKQPKKQNQTKQESQKYAKEMEMQVLPSQERKFVNQ